MATVRLRQEERSGVAQDVQNGLICGRSARPQRPSSRQPEPAVGSVPRGFNTLKVRFWCCDLAVLTLRWSVAAGACLWALARTPGRYPMTTSISSSAAPAVIESVFSEVEKLALAGFLAGYSGQTRQAYALDLRQFTAWCRRRPLRLFALRRADIELLARDLATTARSPPCWATARSPSSSLGHRKPVRCGPARERTRRPDMI